MYTPFSNLTDEELLSHVWSTLDTPSHLEIELAQRLTRRIDEEETCSTMEGAIAPARVGGVLSDA